MDDERNVIDVTSFLLFESIGDSEADSDLNMANSLGQEINRDEVDDAESCSDYVGPIELCDFDHDQEEHDDDHEDDIDDEEEEEEEDGIDQVWSSYGKVVLHKKSKVCVDDSKMNERDKDRHFWETCLAS